METDVKTPIIDFTRLYPHVPENGRMVIVLMRNKDQLVLTCQNVYKGKEKDSNLSPNPVQGTPEELTSALNEMLTSGIIDLEKEYVKGADISRPALKPRIEKKKEALTTAIKKRKAAKTPVKTVAKPAGAKLALEVDLPPGAKELPEPGKEAADQKTAVPEVEVVTEKKAEAPPAENLQGNSPGLFDNIGESQAPGEEVKAV